MTEKRDLGILFLLLLFAAPAAQAQSVMDNLPDAAVEEEAPPAKDAAPASPAAPLADPYTVTDVTADITSDSATHARDQALLQATRLAYAQLCARMGAADTSGKLSDDALAAMVQSFELQSEHVSSVRYIGVFTIQFKPSAAPKQTAVEEKPAPQGVRAHITVAVDADSLATWTQIKRRLNAAPPVLQVDVIDLGRGSSHIDLSYAGAIEGLKAALADQGLILRQSPAGLWELHEGSMVPR